MSKIIEFHLSKPGTGGFSMPGEVKTKTGEVVKNPEGEQVIRHMKETSRRTAPFVWPSGKDFLRLDSERDADMIKYLRNGTRCIGRVGNLKTITYYEKDVEAEIKAIADSTATMARLTGELPKYIGELSDVHKNDEKIRSFALAIGVNNAETSDLRSLWAQIMKSVSSNPAAVESAIKSAGDNLFKSRLEAFKKIGMIDVVSGNAIFYATREKRASGEDGEDLGPWAAFQNKVKAQKNAKAVELWQQLQNSYSVWETTA